MKIVSVTIHHKPSTVEWMEEDFTDSGETVEQFLQLTDDQIAERTVDFVDEIYPEIERVEVKRET